MTRLLASVLVVALPFLHTRSLPAQAPAPAATRSAIQQAVRAYVDATNRGDAAALAALYSSEPGVVAIEDGQITRGWDAIRTEADSIVTTDVFLRLSMTPGTDTYPLSSKAIGTAATE